MITRFLLLFGCGVLLTSPATSQPTADLFAKHCEACHGPGALGTDRGPVLLNSRSLRGQTESQLKDLIRNGRGGMPGFPLPDQDLTALARWVRSRNASAFDLKPEGDAAAGERFFFGQGKCSTCHMVRGLGTPQGPDLSEAGRQ